MSAFVTTLEEIQREERLVGIPVDRPLTDRSITHRRLEIAVVLTIAGLVALFAGQISTGQVKLLSCTVAVLFGVYAIEKDRHLRRLALLRGDFQRISLVVADELMHSGALRRLGDRELLDLRDALGRAAGRIAANLAEMLPAHCTRVRVTGPAGEVPVAAERDLVPTVVPDDSTVARDAVLAGKPVRRGGPEERTIIAAPLWHHDEIVGVVEAVSAPGARFTLSEVDLVDAFGRGVIAGLLAPPA
jgi:hypothetical protein